MERVLAALSSMSYMGFATHDEIYANPDAFRYATESVLHHIADGSGGVILGRASVMVLAHRQDVLCVRLDGPVEARIIHASRGRNIDEATARQEQKETDAAREAYMHTFYGQSLHDPHLYHLMLDSTALDSQACVDIILRAAADTLGLRPIGKDE